MIARGPDGLYHPTSESEVVELVCFARANHLKLRVRGSGHSTLAAILTCEPERDISISLDRMSHVSFDEAAQQVTVEGGCTLTSLFEELDQRGWALPTAAGIIHQTVAGFLATGSSGGSLRHSIARQLVRLRLVDGRGVVHDLRRDHTPDDLFLAAGVSLGLLGVITAATFQCVDRFTVVGSETTSSYADCEIDLFGDGTPVKPSLEQFFRTSEHARLMWFPQPRVERITVWQARRRTPADGPFARQPYHVFPSIGGSMRPAQALLHVLLRALDIVNPPAPTTRSGRLLRGLAERSYPWLASGFLSPGTQPFQDLWWHALAMDNRVDNAMVPMEFTEMWFPLAQTRDLMRELAAYYREGGYRHTGSFSCEIYCTPRNEFWLSPAFQQDVVKINLFWFARNRGNPSSDFFPGVWQRLKPFGYRMHWGKLLCGDPHYLRRQYSRWDEFMRLRARLDPDQLFVSEYWREQLGIAV